MRRILVMAVAWAALWTGGAAAQPAPAPATPPPALGATLVPNPGDPGDVDEVDLAAKPAAVLAGSATWDEGFATLRSALATIAEEARRAGLAVAGRPLAVFVETDDSGFRYEAMVPLDRSPEGRTELGRGVRLGRTPEGRALRFVHKAPYDEVDATYETITAYLDAKGVTVKDAFVEEYVGDLNAADAEIEINIFALPR